MSLQHSFLSLLLYDKILKKEILILLVHLVCLKPKWFTKPNMNHPRKFKTQVLPCTNKEPLPKIELFLTVKSNN